MCGSNGHVTDDITWP